LLDAGTVAQSGKDGNIRVIDLALSSGSTPHRGGDRQTVRTPSGGAVFSALAVEHGAQGVWMYAADGGGTAAWTYQDGRLTSMWSNTSRGTSPVLAEGMLYVYDPSGPSGTLRVYEAHTGRLLASLACGTGHWNSPIVADGRIALPQGNANDHSTTGVLNIWRLP
jgi:hypothetical protein